MTYTEIIDNIQTRIENLIAERFSGTYMNITIEPSDYNPDIDDEITITITVTDQNDDPISNWNVPLTINGTAVATTLTTDTNGQVTYTHSCDDWGVCRFSVNSFATQINVSGWKQIVTGENYDVYRTRDRVKVVLHTTSSRNCTTTWQNFTTQLFSDVSLRPKHGDIVVVGHYGSYMLRMTTASAIMYRSVTGTASTQLIGVFEYPI